MERLTECFEVGFYVDKSKIVDVSHLVKDYFENGCVMGKAIDRLGEFEDFMEGQNIPDLKTLSDTLHKINLELEKTESLKQENQTLKSRWDKLKDILEKDMEHNQKEYDESFMTVFQHYSAIENWVLDRMEELEQGESDAKD